MQRDRVCALVDSVATRNMRRTCAAMPAMPPLHALSRPRSGTYFTVCELFPCTCFRRDAAVHGEPASSAHGDPAARASVRVCSLRRQFAKGDRAWARAKPTTTHEDFAACCELTSSAASMSFSDIVCAPYAARNLGASEARRLVSSPSGATRSSSISAARRQPPAIPARRCALARSRRGQARERAAAASATLAGRVPPVSTAFPRSARRRARAHDLAHIGR